MLGTWKWAQAVRDACVSPIGGEVFPPQGRARVEPSLACVPHAQPSLALDSPERGLQPATRGLHVGPDALPQRPTEDEDSGGSDFSQGSCVFPHGIAHA